MAVHRFQAAWPTGELLREVLAAIVSGPVANAFISTSRTARHNRIGTLSGIPVPRFSPPSMAAIAAAVTEYQTARLEWLTQRTLDGEMERRCHQALLRIDAELLAAYDLPPRVERELLDYFAGYRRPGPVEFDRYYPDGFRPAVPLRMFVSGEIQRASAKQTLRRVPVLRDPVISEAVAELE